MIAKVSPLVTIDKARPRRSGPPSAAAYPPAAGMKWRQTGPAATELSAARRSSVPMRRADSQMLNPAMAMASKRRRSSPAVSMAIVGAPMA